MSNIVTYNGQSPVVPASAYIYPTAHLIGQVELGENASIWCNAVLRGDVHFIRIGENTNIQDFCMLHVSHKSDKDPGGAPLIIGANVTIGHNVVLHGATIGDECLIGIGSIVLDKAVIEPRVLVGAGSLVPPGKILESGWLYMGRPVKPVRRLTEEELAHFSYSARHYVKLAHQYKADSI